MFTIIDVHTNEALQERSTRCAVCGGDTNALAHTRFVRLSSDHAFEATSEPVLFDRFEDAALLADQLDLDPQRWVVVDTDSIVNEEA